MRGDHIQWGELWQHAENLSVISVYPGPISGDLNTSYISRIMESFFFKLTACAVARTASSVSQFNQKCFTDTKDNNNDVDAGIIEIIISGGTIMSYDNQRELVFSSGGADVVNSLNFR